MPGKENVMSKKGKGILKFLLACGVVISAVCAVFAVIYRMRTKLKAVDESEADVEEDSSCDGNCAGCTICGDDSDEAESEDDPDEAETVEE
jgi:hypothetical protein